MKNFRSQANSQKYPRDLGGFPAVNGGKPWQEAGRVRRKRHSEALRWCFMTSRRQRLAGKQSENRPNRTSPALSNFTCGDYNGGVLFRLPRSIGDSPRNIPNVNSTPEVAGQQQNKVGNFCSGEGKPSSGNNFSTFLETILFEFW